MEVGSVEGIDLPHVIGVGFGEGTAALGTTGAVVFEEFVFFDGTAEGGGGDLVAAQDSLLDAGAVEGGDVGDFLMETGEDFFDGFEKVLGGDFASGSFVAAHGIFGDAVLAVVIPPGLDGAPGELAGVSVIVFEDHLADGLVLSLEAVAGGVFEGAKDAHFKGVWDTFHNEV